VVLLVAEFGITERVSVKKGSLFAPGSDPGQDVAAGPAPGHGQIEDSVEIGFRRRHSQDLDCPGHGQIMDSVEIMYASALKSPHPTLRKD